MDSGEFVALDVPEDELRRTVNESRQRILELQAALTTNAHTLHRVNHKRQGKTFEECNMSSCSLARQALGNSNG